MKKQKTKSSLKGFLRIFGFWRYSFGLQDGTFYLLMLFGKNCMVEHSSIVVFGSVFAFEHLCAAHFGFSRTAMRS